MAINNTVEPTFMDRLPSVTSFLERADSLPVYRDHVYGSPVFGYDESLDAVVVSDALDGASGYLAHGHAEKQVASRLGLPTGLPEKLRGIGATDELSRIFNKAVHSSNRDFLMRTSPSDDMIFAALTPSYRRIDNNTILKPILESFNTDEWAAKTWSQKPNFSRFDLLHRETETTLEGKRLIYGISITNSEDGSGRLRIQGLLMVLMCSNGMMRNIMERSQSVVHRGKRQRPGVLDFDQDMEGVLSLVPSTNSILNASMDSMIAAEKAMSYKPSGEKAALTLGVAEWAGATFSERDAMVEASNSYDNSLFGYANIINHVAHQGNVRRNHELEVAAWNLMTEGLHNDGMMNSLAHRGGELLKAIEN